MDNNFQVILAILFVLIAVLIVAVVLIKKYIDEFEKNQSNFMSTQLDKIDRSVKKGLAQIMNEIGLFMGQLESEVSTMKSNHTKLLKGQNEDYKKHTGKLSAEFSGYVTQVDMSNQRLGEILEALTNSMESFDEIRTILLENYDGLEVVTDKTKELIADNEKSILDYKKESSDLYKSLKKRAEDKLKQVEASGEIKMLEVTNSNLEKIKQVSKMVEDTLSQLLDNEHFTNFEANMDELKGHFKAQFEKFGKELKLIDKKVATALLEMNEEKEKKRGGWFGS